MKKKNNFQWAAMNLLITKQSPKLNQISIDLEAFKPIKAKKSPANPAVSPRHKANLTKALKVLWDIQA
tara:strand:- start:578 stop:781 length:204 start_codon:yes stop_codon:yes gene_type:complete